MALFLSNLLLAIPEINSPLTTISDRDKGFSAADDETPLAKRTYYFEHISRTLQAKFGMHARVVLNTYLRFVYTEEGFQPGLQKLDEALRIWLTIFSVRAL